MDKPDLPKLTERDIELLVCAFRCAEGGFPKVDFHKFAMMAKFKNANSASVSFNLVKKKVMSDPGSATPTPKKAGPTKRKKQAVEATEAEDSAESPAKKKARHPDDYPVATLMSTKMEDEDEYKRDYWPYAGI
ncbi:hypothetical protein Daus18300_010370 [Diaporthe australafricana]|uniref:Uncharacterized protein n=1 Tax=Diaporthe australafricana TaxID=127596 RepID=A0ABR3WAN5_9PEZI